MSINSWIFNGRLVAPAKEQKYKDDLSVYNFTVALNFYAGKNKKEDPAFVECELWGSRGKLLTSLDKGADITVTGSFKQKLWKKSDGTEVFKPACRVTDYQIHNSKKSNERSVPVSTPVTNSNTDDDDDDDDDSDVPF